MGIKIPGLSLPIELSNPIREESPHFTWNEALHGGARIPKSSVHTANIMELAAKLEVVRGKLNKPMNITSWYRPEPFNSRAGGAKNSWHLSGLAVDFAVVGLTGKELAEKLNWWEGGMGIYKDRPSIIHLDIRGYRARWGGLV